MKKDTLTYLQSGITFVKAKTLIAKVYSSIEDSGMDISLSSQVKNLGGNYQSLGMDLTASISNVRELDNLTLVERVSAMSFISQKMTLLSHLSANLCSVADYNRAKRELDKRFAEVLWKDNIV